jgi:hypothetical protein
VFPSQALVLQSTLHGRTEPSLLRGLEAVATVEKRPRHWNYADVQRPVTSLQSRRHASDSGEVPVVVVEDLFAEPGQLACVGQGDQIYRAHILVGVVAGEATGPRWNMGSNAFIVGDDQLLLNFVVSYGRGEVAGWDITDDGLHIATLKIDDSDRLGVPSPARLESPGFPLGKQQGRESSQCFAL